MRTDTILSYSLNEPRCSSLPSSPAKRVSPAKKKQFFINQAIRNSDLTPRAKGKKSLRRQENTRFLDNLLERDECSKEDAEGHETALPTIFTEACTNGNYVEGVLEGLESDLLRFFMAHPHSIYITKLSSSYERLLLHAICQYMDLTSASSDCNGARQTKVVNKQAEFLPPQPLLSAYLEQLS
ncbi:R3H domain-containing 4-like protein [Labeo rohita]|uniref:R3H domain-containing 4-like protein n=1 Tax=Labeo rohita TaxID=84645 RepID=A0A498LIT7_LABRO|nr:R3H domain-containing 4-like protein [Labeo rohita]